ncbi:hypothetical protein [Kitasatospora sp. NPDC050543]|uniref:LppU/SCO3897 family protein n=1 Tax=Kitasatospora sp. NPDC050543 TaxID=3364054 RepID=UPI0037959FB9
MTTPSPRPAADTPPAAAQTRSEAAPLMEPPEHAELPPYAGAEAEAGAGAEAAPSRRRWFGPGVRAGLGFVVVAALALFAVAHFSDDDPRTAQVGSCVHNFGNDTAPQVLVVDCRAANADTKVLKVVHSSNKQECETEPGLVATYSEEGTSSIVILCLGDNA